MAQAVGHAVLPIIPSLQGIGKELAKQLNVPASQAADKAASDIRKGMASGVDEAAKAVEKAQWRIKKAAEESADAESKLRAAKEKSAASQASLQAAEAKLSTLRDSEKTTSEQLLKAEAEIARKRASVETASNGVAKAERGVEGAMTESKRAADSLARAQKELEDAQNGTSKSSKTLTDSVDKSTNSVKGMHLKMGALAGAVGGVFAGIAQSAVGSFGSLIAGASEASDATDKFKKTLDFAGLDTSAIDSATKRAQDYADKTVYNLGDIQNMTAQLAANGIKDYSGLAEAAGNLNAVAGGNAETFKSVGMVMSQTAGAGKLTTENWNQLSDAIPGAAGKIQESLLKAGAYTGNFRDAMADGEITADEFNKAIMELGTQPVAVEAAKSTQTFEGMLGNLQATIEGGLANAFNELKPYIEDFVNSLSKFLESALPLLVTGIKGAVESIKFLASAFSKLPEVMKTVSTWIEDNKGKLLGFAAVVSPVIVPLLIGLAAKWTAAGVASTISAANQAKAWLITKAEAVKSAAISIASLWKVGAGWIAAGAKAIVGAGRVALAWTIAKAQSVGALLTSIAAIGIGWAAAGVKALAGAARVAAAWVIGLGPIAWVTAAVAGLVAGLTWFFTQTEVGKVAWQAFTSALATAWKFVTDSLIAGWNWLKTTVIDAWNAYWANVKMNWELLTSGISWAWNTVTSTLSAGWAIIRDAVVAGWNAAWGGLRAIWSGITTMIVASWTWLKDTFVFVWNWIKNVVVNAWNIEVQGMKNLWSIVTGAIVSAWTWLKDTFIAIWNWIKNAVINLWNAEVRGMRQLFDIVTGAIARAWNWLKDALYAGWSWIRDNVFGSFRRGLDFLKGAFNSTVEGIRSIWDKLRAATARPVKFVIDSVWNKGIVGAWNKIAGFVPGLDKVSEFKPGWMGAYATGGVLPGYTPGRDVHNFYSPTGGRLMLSGGEAIMRPEWTRAVGGPAAVEQMNAAARSGKLQPVEKHTNHSAAHKHALGGILKFAQGGVVEAMTRIVQKKYPMLQMTSGYDNRPGYHGMGLAADFSNGSGNTPEQLALARDIAHTYPGSLELIYDAPGWAGNIKNGRNVGAFGQFYTMAQAGPHYHHVHWAMNTPPTMDFGGGVFKGGSGGGGFLSSAWGWAMSEAQKAWDAAMEPIKKKITGTWDNVKDSLPAKIPGLMFKNVKEKAWEFIKSKIPFGDSGGGGNANWNPGAGAEQWRSMLIKAFRFQGEEPRKDRVDALIRQIHTESHGDPNIAQQIVDQNGTGEGAGVGLYQVIPSTWEAFRDPRLSANRRDPWAQNNFAVRYFRDKHHWDTSFVGQGHGWKTGGVLPENLALFDSGGMLQPNMVATNKTKKPEPVFTAEQWNVLKRSIVSKAEAQDWRGMFNELGKAINKFGVVANKLGQRAQTDFGRWQRGEHIMTAEDKRLATPNEMRMQLGYMMGSEAASEVGKIFGFSDSMVKGLLDMAGFKDPKLVDESGQVTVQAQSVSVEPTGKASIAPAAAEPKNTQQAKPAAKKPEDSAPVIKIGNVTIHGGATQADAQRFVRGVQSEWERVRGRMARVN